MTEPAGTPPGAAPYSKDYWDNVFEQVGRRPLVKAALALLALLYASAIYAPLIANDRPYVLEAVDYGAYQTAQKTLSGSATYLRVLVTQGEESFLEGLSPRASVRTWAGALEAERRALADRIATMRAALVDVDTSALDELEEAAGSAVELALAGSAAEAEAAADRARDLAREARDEFRALDPGAPEEGGVELRGETTYPLAEATSGLEVLFMVLWLFILGWPLWNRAVNRLLLRGDRERIRRARRRKLGAVLAVSLAAGGLWSAIVGGHLTFESAAFKGGITSGEIVATRAVFPPLAFGFAETHLDERFRPPTWRPHSEISEEGYFVRGPLAPRADAATGTLPPPQPVTVRFAEPGRNDPWRHLTGTDSVGRDLFARILWGGRISLAVGILSTVLLVLIGTVFGALAGYFGRWVDTLISRVIEVFQSIPAFFLILTAVAMIPDERLHPVFAIVIFIAVVRWTGVARLVRGEFLRLKDQEFVVAAQALGFSSRRVIFRHVLPNATGPVLVAAAFSVAAGILTESAISFLGLGIKPPIASWGSLINDSRDPVHWWIQIFPGLLIFLTIFCYNVVGEGVRDALDPRRKV